MYPGTVRTTDDFEGKAEADAREERKLGGDAREDVCGMHDRAGKSGLSRAAS